MNKTGNLDKTKLNASVSVDVLLQVAVDAHKSGDLEKAETHYRKLLETDPKNSNALHLLGFIAHQLGFGEEGLALIKEAISYDPDIFLFHSNLAKVCLGLKDTEQAETAYRRCLQLESGNLDIMNDLANLLRTKEKGPDSKSLKEAIVLLGKVVRQKPVVCEYQINYGNVLRDNHQLEEANICYEKVLDINPNFTGALQNIGIIHYMEKNYELAKEYANKVLKLNPMDGGSLNNLAQISCSENQLDEGIEYYERASEADPDNAVIFCNKAKALMRRRRDEEALEALQKSMELDSSKPEYFALFASTLRLMEKIKESEDFVQTAIKIFPDDPNLLCELAINLQFQFEFSRSEELSRRIVDKYPWCGEAMLVLAIVLIHTGEKEEVLELFKELFKSMPDHPAVSFNYALTMFTFGNLEEGWKHYHSRWEVESFTSPVRPFPQDLWDGSS